MVVVELELMIPPLTGRVAQLESALLELGRLDSGGRQMRSGLELVPLWFNDICFLGYGQFDDWYSVFLPAGHTGVAQWWVSSAKASSGSEWNDGGRNLSISRITRLLNNVGTIAISISTPIRKSRKTNLFGVRPLPIREPSPHSCIVISSILAT